MSWVGWSPDTKSVDAKVLANEKVAKKSRRQREEGENDSTDCSSGQEDRRDLGGSHEFPVADRLQSVLRNSDKKIQGDGIKYLTGFLIL